MSFDDELAEEELISKEQKWLLIENPGLSDIEFLVMIGASSSRGDTSKIGKFGSGTAYSIALFLRKGIETRLYRGKQGYVFGSNQIIRQTHGRDQTLDEVFIRGLGPSVAKKSLGFDRSMGEVDWNDLAMGLRELISNAADASQTEVGNYTKVKVSITERIKPRNGTTQWYISFTEEVEAWVRDKFKVWFPIFDRDWDGKTRILPKRGKEKNLKIYKKGVLVGQLPEESIFDYNIPDIHVDESRVIRHGDAREACALEIARAPVETLKTWLRTIKSGRDVFEVTGIDCWTLIYASKTNQEFQNWDEAFRSVYGNNAVVTSSPAETDAVTRKGYDTCVVSRDLAMVMNAFNIRNASSVLDSMELLGRQKYDLTPDQVARCRGVWLELERLGATKGRPLPTLEGFFTTMDSGGTTFAYYDLSQDRVVVSRDIVDDEGLGFVKVMIEEYGHAITKARDCTRDLQDFAFRLAATLMLELKRARRD